MKRLPIHVRYLIIFGLGILIAGIGFGVYQTVIISSKNIEEKEKPISKQVKDKTIMEEKQAENSPEENREDSTPLKTEPVQESENTQKEELTTTVDDSSFIEDTSETAVSQYFEEQQQLITTGNQQDESLIEKVKEGFSNIYQFLFHGGTIKGYTFSELTAATKLKVLKLALTIDDKINQIFPNYKDRIKGGFSNLKAKVVAKYLEVTAKICENHTDTCTQAREDFKKMKQSFGLTFSMIKEFLSNGSSALKEWYNS